MKSAMEIYKEAKKCAKEHNAENDIKCLKKFLVIEIKNDRERLLAYKSEVFPKASHEEINSFISTIAFIISIFSLGITTITKIYVDENYVKIVIGILILILLGVTFSVRKEMKNSDKYKVIKIVIEDIEREMEEKESN